jgi:hypothetical protein
MTPTGITITYDEIIASAKRRAERSRPVPITKQAKSAATRRANLKALRDERLAALRGDGGGGCVGDGGTQV